MRKWPVVVIIKISIHAPREGGDIVNQKKHLQNYISIHAPREGGDNALADESAAVSQISIHAPREGGDHKPMDRS